MAGSHGFEMEGLHQNSIGTDFEPQMRAIGATLKKRFFRKPNVSEAVEQYEALCQELRREGQDFFAGICSLEIAKCHEMLQNHSERCSALLKAADFFFEAQQYQNMLSPLDKPRINSGQNSFFYKNHWKAMSTLQQAVDLFKEQQLFAVALLILMNMGKKSYLVQDYERAHVYYKAALDLANTHYQLSDEVMIVEKVLDCKVMIMDFKSAEKLSKVTLERMRNTINNQNSELPSELYHKYTMKFEIIRAFLVLAYYSRNVDHGSLIWKDSTLVPNEGSVHTFSATQKQERGSVYDSLRSLVIATHQRSFDEIRRALNRLVQFIPELHPTLWKLYNYLIKYL